MATYDSVTRWASKTDRKSVQLWLPRDVVAALDEQAADQNKPDPVTGGQRKVSRADVITLLVREGRGRWSELVYGMEELMGDWKGLYEKEIRDREEAESEAEETREAQSKAERLAD